MERFVSTCLFFIFWKVNAPFLDLVPISGPCCRITPSFFYKIETWLEKLLPLPITTISLIPLKQKQTSILRMLHQQSCDQPPKSYLKLHQKTSPNPAKMTQCAKQLRSEKSEITFNLIHQLAVALPTWRAGSARRQTQWHKSSTSSTALVGHSGQVSASPLAKKKNKASRAVRGAAHKST